MSEFPVSRNYLPSGFTGRRIYDELSNRELLIYTHTCGFKVHVLPRPGFSRKFAAVGVPYGAVHTTIYRDGQKIILPPGTAHFLEHCIFSRDEHGGLMGSLSEMGASANAYTSYNHTLYYFTAVDRFADALEIYLKAILDPYLEPDRVEAEKPIIMAEIDQYLDDPDMRAMVNLLQNMYKQHPVRCDIAGTASSVDEISSNHLKQVAELFYHPGMLQLTISGDIDINSILIRLARQLEPWQAPRAIAEIKSAAEPAVPGRRNDTFKMDISAPSFLIGIKDPLAETCQSGSEQFIRQKSAQLLLATLLSPAADLHDRLYNRGLINESFSFSYINDLDFGFALCGGESMQADVAAREVVFGICEQLGKGIDCQLFANEKKAAAGALVQALDSVEHSGLVQAQANFKGINIFDYPKIYDKINCAQATEMMSFLTDAGQYSITVINPMEVNDNYDT